MQVRPPLTATLTSIPSYYTGLYWATLVCTGLFIVSFLPFAYLLFDIQNGSFSLIMTIWSTGQLIIAVYSIMLLLTPVAFKIVLLYIKVLVQVSIVFYLFVYSMMIVLSFVFGIIEPTSEARTNSFMTILYQLGLSGPGMLMMWPLIFYISQIQTYLDQYYSIVISMSKLAYMQEVANYGDKNIKPDYILLQEQAS